MPSKNRNTKIRPKITLHNPTVPDMYWGKEIEDTMKLGYPYEIAYALVSKAKVQELFENDVRIVDGR